MAAAAKVERLSVFKSVVPVHVVCTCGAERVKQRENWRKSASVGNGMLQTVIFVNIYPAIGQERVAR